MTTEEKKVIEILKIDKPDVEYAIHKEFGREYGKIFKENYTAILKLVEKQEKEIEDSKQLITKLMNERDVDYKNNNYISKEAIREKIEELEKLEQEYESYGRMKYLEGAKYYLNGLLGDEKNE